ncbi:MAG: NADH-quinone oxidoreductase subunit NuoE [Planctomycetes bacterium]|nr:NADH-quinone oxidoreductase subunit NuoE [Planctomycetota bacterium]
MVTAELGEILDRYAHDRTQVISILQDVQDRERYLPEAALTYVAQALEMPRSQIYSLATFYRAFSLEPRGEHTILVCTGTACHVRGAPRLVEELCRRLEIKPGGTTADGKFTLETVNCLGACALGPLVMVDDDYHGQMTPNKLEALLEQYS